MLDVNNIPSQFSGNVQVFSNTPLVGTIWVKPNNCTMAYILCIGSGGGGGAGGQNVATSNGGGGGGSGSITSMIVPLSILPDILWINVPTGGAGVSGGVGGIGNFVTVSIVPANIAGLPQDMIIRGMSAAGGTSSSAGGAGGGATALSQSAFSAICISALRAGASGVATDTSVTALASSPLTGGAGGGSQTVAGSVDNPGGNITGAGIYPTISGGAGSTIGNASPGRSAMQYILNNLISSGGAGGGGSVLGIGGNGGNGGVGGGGGGGGAGTTTGGTGGNGGAGMAIIACW